MSTAIPIPQRGSWCDKGLLSSTDTSVVVTLNITVVLSPQNKPGGFFPLTNGPSKSNSVLLSSTTNDVVQVTVDGRMTVLNVMLLAMYHHPQSKALQNEIHAY